MVNTRLIRPGIFFLVRITVTLGGPGPLRFPLRCFSLVPFFSHEAFFLGEHPPKTNSSPLKIGHPKRKLVFPTIHFQVLLLLVSVPKK